MRRGNGPATLRIVPSPQTGEEFIWDDDVRPAINYDALGRTLAARGDLFRNSGHGGLMLIAPDGTHRLITKGSDLYPVIVDRVHVRVHKDGKTKGSRIPAADLNAMLRSETFLGQFPVLDLVVSRPMYLPGFNLTEPGYNDGGPGHRIYYRGGAPEISDSLDTINKFLDVMEWDSPADRTNAVGAALTVMLRNHWLGQKPIILVTATKSGGGKGTVVDFACATDRSILVPYQSEDWAFERGIAEAIATAPDAGLIVIDNARLGRKDKAIASACLERAVTDPKPFFFSSGSNSIRTINNRVFAITTNFGMVSEDTMNTTARYAKKTEGQLAEATEKLAY